MSLAKCYDNRDCRAKRMGMCEALSETYPAGKPCPFCKSKKQFIREILELVAKGHIVDDELFQELIK